jgi:hypothetical protein
VEVVTWDGGSGVNGIPRGWGFCSLPHLEPCSSYISPEIFTFEIFIFIIAGFGTDGAEPVSSISRGILSQ